MDSPSRQLLDELRMRHRDGEKKFKRKLDDATADQERSHHEQLAYASAEHKRVRLNAERSRERFLLEQERARRRVEEEENQKLEQAKADAAEKERQAIADRERQELAELRRQQEEFERRRRLDEERRALERARQDEEARIQQQRQDDERRAAEQRTAREQADKQETERQRAASQPQANGVAAAASSASPLKSSAAAQNGLTTPLNLRKKEHAEYLALHKRLKELRKTMTQFGKQDQALKAMMGDGRRSIIKTVGQMNFGNTQEVKNANRQRIIMIRQLLEQARSSSQYPMDVRNFMIASRQVAGSDAEAKVSGLFLYLLNQVSKCVIRQYVGDAGINPAKAEPVGLLLASVFGNSPFQWNGTTYLIDILLAKYHKLCPVIFGIHDAVPKGFSQEYGEKMTGLAGGFAAITLRDFSRAQAKNPLPASIFWRTLAMIVNTPPNGVKDTHFLVLKALLDPVYVEKFVRFYGDVGISLVRKAVLGFPAQSNGVAANGVKVLPDIYRRELKLVLQ